MKRVTLFLAIFFAVGFTPAPADIINIPGDYPTIQEGIDAANEYDTVLVKPGFYEENIQIDVLGLVLASLFLTSGDTSYISSTIIDGNSAGSVIRSLACYDTTAAIIGFTIQNGYNEVGGGILCVASNPRITNNIITQNTAIDNGGGIYCFFRANPIIRNNIIIGNVVQNRDWNFGGGIYCENSNPEITDNYIIENEACWGGGIAAVEYSSPTISNNIIARNIADP